MAHTHHRLLFHLVWSTKNREPLITQALKHRLYGYMRSILLQEGAHVVVINGMQDHVHILLGTKPSHSLPELVKRVKASSSKWVSDTVPGLGGFGWQEGYGAFSVGFSNKEAVVGYILNQEEHHKDRSYQDEYLHFLKKQEISFDERFVLG